MNVRIVLVEPREAGNVGAVARAMKNFGFDDLVIAGEHPPLEPLAGWWASGADDVVDRARRVASLAAAIEDAALTIATTSLRGRSAVAPPLTPRAVAALYRTLGREQTLALVFGREDSGLTREEVALCQRTAAIPTDSRFPTMNLAQAVCLFCYELSGIEPAAGSRERAPAGMIERLHARAQALLIEAGYLHENNPDRIYDEFRAIAGRAALDAREVTLLLGALQQIEWRIRKTS